MKQFKIITLFTLIISVLSCGRNSKPIYEKYDFEIKGFDWDPTPYKFSELIKDSVIIKQGAQYASWDYSYIGDIENMLITWDTDAKPRETLNNDEIMAFNTFERNKALPVIIEEAKKAEVVIINEAHQMPQHRVFTTQLLQGLYNEGYRHLGMESFFASKKSDSTLLANNYPILTNGYYIKEPQYGNIVRQAVKIGFKVFGYESQGHANSKEREINQANNIKGYIELNPNGKYLIHCGFAHGAEGEYGGSWEKTMAGRLTEFTGIDPLTIDQTKYSEKSKKEYEDPYYQLTDVYEPSVFISNDSIFGKYKEGTWFDIAVFHPRTKDFDRPKWMLYGSRKIRTLDLKNAQINCPCLVFAYLESEEIGAAIPYDIQQTNDKKVSLVLEKATYNLIILNEKGESLMTQIEY